MGKRRDATAGSEEVSRNEKDRFYFVWPMTQLANEEIGKALANSDSSFGEEEIPGQGKQQVWRLGLGVDKGLLRRLTASNFKGHCRVFYNYLRGGKLIPYRSPEAEKAIARKNKKAKAALKKTCVPA